MEAETTTGRLRGVVAAYVALTKPRIVLLLLVTTFPAMVLAGRALPSAALVGITLVGGTLCAGGANAINQFIERASDEMMRRTRRRPLLAGRIPPSHALIFAMIASSFCSGIVTRVGMPPPAARAL